MVIIVVAVLALVTGGSDDSRFRDQTAEEIVKYGYDPKISDCKTQRNANVFGVSIVKVSGTFMFDGIDHRFVITVSTDYKLYTWS